ncbi:MAG: indole-3-glycerol phosphate synthase TrpC [Eubacteriaceae bacterium]|jgi:indole-3-glycerol phosphate synthase
MNILIKLAEESGQRVAAARKTVSDEEIRHRAVLASLEKRRAGRGWIFEKTLAQPGTGIIAELKKASPSKGLISEEFEYLDILSRYEEGGASCVSCLTEPDHFLGSLDILKDVCAHTDLPVLRKDFTVDPYQIYEAAACGADAVLLIAGILTDDELKTMIGTADALAMSALVETHNAGEIRRAAEAGARVIGINNRDLSDFSVDLQTSVRLTDEIPGGAVFVSESGIRTPADVRTMEEAGAGAVLVGESLMTADDIVGELGELLNREDLAQAV